MKITSKFKHTIVYFQHAGEIGGSVISLLRILEEIQEYSNIIIICKYSHIAEFYKNKGYQVEVLQNMVQIGHCSGLSYSIFQPKSLLRLCSELLHLPMSIYKIIQILKKYHATILHINSSTILSAGIAAKLIKLPVVWHIREKFKTGTFGLRRSIIRKIIESLSTKIVGISELEEKEFIDSNKFTKIYNSLNFNIWDQILQNSQSDTQKQLKLSLDKKYLITLGGINQIKGSLEIINALKHLSDDYELLILGATTSRNPNMNLLKKKIYFFVDRIFPSYDAQCIQAIEKVKNRVHLIGRTENVAQYLYASDILLFITNVIHFPRPIFEALTLEKAIISSNLIQLKDLSDNPLIQYVANEPNQIADAILNLSTVSSDVKQKISQDIRKKFNSSNNNLELIKIYQSIN